MYFGFVPNPPPFYSNNPRFICRRMTRHQNTREKWYSTATQDGCPPRAHAGHGRES